MLLQQLMIYHRFWLRAMRASSPSAQERFVASFAEYAYAVIDEASDRANGTVRKLTDYLRLTLGRTRVCFL
jgi:Delta6-protoilludene synthase